MISKYAKLVEMLTRNFIKAMRRQPNNLENLKIKQQAAETIRQEQKIIPFKYKKTFGEEIKEMEEKGVGSLFKKTAETEDEILARLNKQNRDTIEKIKSRKQKTAEEMMDEGDFDPSGMATGGFVARGASRLIKELSKIKNKSKLLTDDQIVDLEVELGDTEGWLSEGTVKEALEAVKRRKDELEYYYGQYKTGKLDPKPGEVNRSRLDFLKRRAEEAEMSGDRRLITGDELDELDSLEKRFEYLDLEDKAQNISRKMTDEEIQKLKEINDSGYVDFQKEMDRITRTKKAEGGYVNGGRVGLQEGGITNIINSRLKNIINDYRLNELTPTKMYDNFQDHVGFNQFLRGQVGKQIDRETYNKLGGYDVTQRVVAGNPILGGLGNLAGAAVYNLGENFFSQNGVENSPFINEDGSAYNFQTITTGQPLSEIPGTVIRNVVGGSRLIPDDQVQLYRDLRQQYENSNTPTSSGALITDRPTMADVAGAAKTDPRAGIQEAFLNELLTTGPNQGQSLTSVMPDFDRYGTYTGGDQLLKDYAAAGRGTPTSQLVKLPANHPYAVSGPGYYEYNGTEFSKTADLNMTPEYEKMIRLNYGLASNGTTNQTASVNSLGPSKYSANATKSFDEFLKDEGIVPDTVNYNGEPGRYMSTDGTVVDINHYKDMYDGSYGTSNQPASLNSMGPATYGTTEEEEDLNVTSDYLALGLSPGKAVTTAMDAARKYGPSIASFIFSGGLTGPAEAMRAGAKQVAASKVSDALSERILGNLTQQVARENQSSNTGGYQSSWGGVSDFMSGSGTSADMGSFKKGGSVKKSIRERIINLVGGPSAAAAELGLEGILQIYDLLGMPLFAKGGLAKNKLTDTVPPEKGPDSQGVESLFRRK
jgi:hypothetical protein